MINTNDGAIGICLLARTESKRLPRKALLEIQGKPTIIHLANRLSKSEYPLHVCIPNLDTELKDLLMNYNIPYFMGDDFNCLHRMLEYAQAYNLDHVIRVTHDDMFIDVKILQKMVKYHLKSGNDYTYTALIPEGMGAEVYKVSALRKAYEKNKDVNIEGVSNYFRNDDYEVDQYRPDFAYQYPQYRLTMDYPEDFTVISLICEQLPFHTDQINSLDIINLIKRTPSLRKINHMPKVSVYIPNHNYGEYLELAITSALAQTYEDLEVIVVDDCSTDNSFEVLKKYIFPNSRVKVIFNEKNIGLPASANKAIEIARGKYIMRIDADDMLLPNAIEKLLDYVDGDDDIGMVFGGYVDCDKDMTVSTGTKKLPPFDQNENEFHPTGAIVRKRYWNDIKYDAMLKGFESYDFYKRFSAKFNIGLMQEVVWLKRSHDKSMMVTDIENRDKIKKELDAKYVRN